MAAPARRGVLSARAYGKRPIERGWHVHSLGVLLRMRGSRSVPVDACRSSSARCLRRGDVPACLWKHVCEHSTELRCWRLSLLRICTMGATDMRRQGACVCTGDWLDIVAWKPACASVDVDAAPPAWRGILLKHVDYVPHVQVQISLLATAALEHCLHMFWHPLTLQPEDLHQ